MKLPVQVYGFLVLSGALLVGCASPGGKLQDDAAPLTTGELYNYFSETTQIRGDGTGIYFTEFGTLINLADGERMEGTWSSHDGGVMCPRLPLVGRRHGRDRSGRDGGGPRAQPQPI
ncbi:MAG: hypothetical protein AAF420_11770, partial [Pseudomonadota bacterium]